ncbi:DALR anticodon-binding domain-containing protein, partial [Bordetella pertussis]
RPGDLVRVRPGERIAADGTISEGQSAIDQSPITGESLPVEKGPDDDVYAGTVNASGSFDYRVTAAAGNTTLDRIIHAVEQAQGARAPTQRFIDRFSRIYTPAVVGLAVLVALAPPLHQVAARVRAVAAFAQLPAAASLAAANKRIGNLLKKAEGEIGAVDAALLQDPAEKALAEAVAQLRPQARAQLQAGDFAASLATLAQAREPVDAFFADVMVMADDAALRANRLALLGQLHGLMNQVADISRLAQ